MLNLNDGCAKMIQKMKESHEMLEVTDMTKPAEVGQSVAQSANKSTGLVDQAS